MKRLLVYLSISVTIAFIIGGCQAKRKYQKRIPNGENVTSPCGSGIPWPGVGHWMKEGEGDVNPFGIDFQRNKDKWNATLCSKDSDGDGKTNAEELGDPECVWTIGAIPARTTNITHPGICEPIDSDNCKKRNGDNFRCSSGAMRATKTGVASISGMVISLFLVLSYINH